MPNVVFSAAIAVLFCASVSATGAGLQIDVAESGIDVFRDAVLNIVNTNFSSLTIPNISLEEDIPVVGHVTFDLTDIEVYGVHVSTANINLAPPATADIAIAGANANIKMNFHYRKVHWPHISGSGTITVSAEDGTFSVDTVLSLVNNLPNIRATGSSATFANFNIHFSGHDEWIYNLVAKLFKGTIDKAVEKGIASALTGVVDNTLNKDIAKINTHLHIGGGGSEVDINAGLSALTIAGQTFQVSDMFAISDAKTGARCPFPYPALPASLAGASNMLQIQIGVTALTCIGWVSYINHALHIYYTPQTLPPNFPIKLNTDAWSLVVPALTKKYPDQNMTANITLGGVPTFTTAAATGVTINAKANVALDVLSSSGQTYALTLGVAMTIGADAYINSTGADPAVGLKLTSLGLDFSVVNSAIGPVEVGPLQGLVKLLTPVVEAIVNGILAGLNVPLPSLAGLSLVQPEILYTDAAIGVTSNFAYKP